MLLLHVTIMLLILPPLLPSSTLRLPSRFCRHRPRSLLLDLLCCAKAMNQSAFMFWCEARVPALQQDDTLAGQWSGHCLVCE